MLANCRISWCQKTFHNDGNYIVSMGNVCRWLAAQAEELGVEIFPGFAAAEVIYDDNNAVAGVITGDMGVGLNGEPKDGYMPGMELRAKYTVFAEGCRGHLGKELIAHYQLDQDSTPQHYAIGFKEIWDVPAEQHEEGVVVHSTGWPLKDHATGGGYLYHAEGGQVFVGLIVDLNYTNPHLNPFAEFQRFKQHPQIRKVLENGKRVSYGARAIAKGGFYSLPKMTMPGAVLVGCDAGTLNFAKIKGNHTAMKSGLLAAGRAQVLVCGLVAPITRLTKNFFGGKLPFTYLKTHSRIMKACSLRQLRQKLIIQNLIIRFRLNRNSSVYLSNTNHEEDQPCHLQLADASIPISVNLAKFDEPAQRYCPAGVYEVVTSD